MSCLSVISVNKKTGDGEALSDFWTAMDIRIINPYLAEKYFNYAPLPEDFTSFDMLCMVDNKKFKECDLLVMFLICYGCFYIDSENKDYCIEMLEKFDFSDYVKLSNLKDRFGCYQELIQFLKDCEIKDDEAIFLVDSCDCFDAIDVEEYYCAKLQTKGVIEYHLNNDILGV